MIEGVTHNDFFETFDEVIDQVHEVVVVSQASFNSHWVQLRIVVAYMDENAIRRSMFEFYEFFRHEKG
jgi:hypothetical protein